MSSNMVLLITLIICGAGCLALYFHEKKKDSEGK